MVKMDYIFLWQGMTIHTPIESTDRVDLKMFSVIPGPKNPKTYVKKSIFFLSQVHIWFYIFPFKLPWD